MNEADSRVAKVLKKLGTTGNMAMAGMTFVDDLAMVGGTYKSYDNPDTCNEAWEHPNTKEREYWRDAVRKEFNDMIQRKVWRDTSIDDIPEDRKLIDLNGCSRKRKMESTGHDWLVLGTHRYQEFITRIIYCL